jgi:uncharacterized protein YbaA (DUF1428 family)
MMRPNSRKDKAIAAIRKIFACARVPGHQFVTPAHQFTLLAFSPRAANLDTPSTEQRTFEEKSMAYVDGFVIPLPKDKIDDYREMSRKCGEVWREYGALSFRECIADDVKPGQWTSFPQSVKLEDNEVVVFSWIEFNSRAERDAINDKVMKDPRLADIMKPEAMPFDGKRMIYGGFESLVEL